MSGTRRAGTGAVRADTQASGGSTPFQGDDATSGPSRERMDGPPALTLRTMQSEVAAWHCREFPDASPDQLGLIVGEEAGEVMRCVLKLGQGIRQETNWRAELEKESADVLVALLALADRFGFDLDTAWLNRFRGTVRHRRFASRVEPEGRGESVETPPVVDLMAALEASLAAARAGKPS